MHKSKGGITMLDMKGKIMAITLSGFMFLAPLIGDNSSLPPVMSAGLSSSHAEGIIEEKRETETDVHVLEDEPVEIEEVEKRYEPDEKELELLARAVYSEARGEPEVGQVAVAAVILNRLEDEKFPNTISGVIFQPRAFTAVADGQFWYTPNKKAYEAVEKALVGEDPSDGAIFYYNPATASSRWIYSRPVIKRIGRHLFAR
jgi:spore germination cell wall hydrolase CwlJ-like protein